MVGERKTPQCGGCSEGRAEHPSPSIAKDRSIDAALIHMTVILERWRVTTMNVTRHQAVSSQLKSAACYSTTRNHFPKGCI